MVEKLSSDVTSALKESGVVVAENPHTVVVDFTDQNLVAKHDKTVRFASKEEAQASLERMQKREVAIRAELKRLGSKPEIVPQSEVLVHELEGNEVGITRVQQNLQGIPLAGRGLSVLSLPEASLLDLHNLYAVSLKHYLHTGNLLDLAGKPDKELTRKETLLRECLPLFHTTNIVTDTAGNVSYVDVGIIEVNKAATVKEKVHHHLKAFGQALSFGLVTGAIISQRMRNKTPVAA